MRTEMARAFSYIFVIPYLQLKEKLQAVRHTAVIITFNSILFKHTSFISIVIDIFSCAFMVIMGHNNARSGKPNFTIDILLVSP